MKLLFNKYKKKLLIFLMVIGPGLITAFADNDAGGVATYSVAASKYGYKILTVLIPITVVLAITQEIGSRIAIVTGKGLGDLIRERFGIKVAISVFFITFIVNFGVILQDLSGLKGAIQLFKLDYRIFLPLVLLTLFFVVIKSNYSKIERFFLFLILFYLTYFFSAIMAKPDWGMAIRSIVYPPGNIGFDYLYTSIAVLGTTVTIWGQFFINSVVKDKKLTLDNLKYEKTEIFFSSILSDIVTWFIMLAVIGTVYKNGVLIRGAEEAALAIKPFAGELAGILFGVGLFVAGFLGCAIVPLATAYAFSEFFGYSGSLDSDFKKSRLFYSLFIIQIVIGGIIVFQPNFSLFRFTLIADFLNGISLPIIFYFLYNLSNNEHVMGKYKNTKLQNILLVGSALIISAGSLLGIIGKIFHF